MKNVTAAPPFAGTVCVTARELTGLMAVPSSVRAPSSVKSSQKVSAPSHQRLRFQPRRCVVVSGAAPKTPRTIDPFMGSAAGRNGLSINRPARLFSLRKAACLPLSPTIF
jgi:hypothetical protein